MSDAREQQILNRLGGGIVSVFAQPVSIGSSQTTVLVLSGPGVINNIDYQSALGTFSVVIAADGRTVYNGSPYTTSPQNYSYAPLLRGPLHFNSSFSITAAGGTSGESVPFDITYSTGV